MPGRKRSDKTVPEKVFSGLGYYRIKHDLPQQGACGPKTETHHTGHLPGAANRPSSNNHRPLVGKHKHTRKGAHGPSARASVPRPTTDNSGSLCVNSRLVLLLTASKLSSRGKAHTRKSAQNNKAEQMRRMRSR